MILKLFCIFNKFLERNNMGQTVAKIWLVQNIWIWINCGPKRKDFLLWRYLSVFVSEWSEKWTKVGDRGHNWGLSIYICILDVREETQVIFVFVSVFVFVFVFNSDLYLFLYCIRLMTGGHNWGSSFECQ